MYSEEEMFDNAPKVVNAWKKFFTLKPYRGFKFFNPCKKCLVRPACSLHCKKRRDYDHSKEIKMALWIGMGMLVTVSLLSFISIMLFTHEYKVSSTGFTVFWIMFFVHFWFLVGDS